MTNTHLSKIYGGAASRLSHFFDQYAVISSPQTQRAAPPVGALFWAVAALFATLLVAGVNLRTPSVTACATALLLLGGLPHGAFDIALATRVFRLGHTRATALFAAYIAAAGLMAALWWAAPAAALAGFLLLAAYHFGEDWTVLDDALLRVATGAAPLAAAAFGQNADVMALFQMMAGADAGKLSAQILFSMAPVILLIAAVALMIAATRGARHWAAAMAAALIALIILPPLPGFALYFACLHSPRHMAEMRAIAHGRLPASIWLHGGGTTLLALSGLWLFLPAGSTVAIASDWAAKYAAGGFILLSVLAVPHLALSTAVSRFLAREHTHNSNNAKAVD